MGVGGGGWAKLHVFRPLPKKRKSQSRLPITKENNENLIPNYQLPSKPKATGSTVPWRGDVTPRVTARRVRRRALTLLLPLAGAWSVQKINLPVQKINSELCTKK